MADDRLQSAIRLVHSGKISEARRELELIIKADPCDVPAWFWYSETWTSSEQRIQILQACLRVNPTSVQVQQALAVLTSGAMDTILTQMAGPSRTTTAEPPAKASQPTPAPANVAPQESGYRPPAAGVKTGTQLNPVLQNRPKRKGSTNWYSVISLIVATVFLVALGIFAYNSIPADPAKNRHEAPIEYYLYVPRNYSADREWPLFVGVHGAGGTGLDCWNWWQSYADKEGFILLCPSIAGPDGGWYQADGETKVFSAINQVRVDYHVAPREFLAGFSAGAQFVQGVAFKYPQYVSGVSILSAGNYYRPVIGARGIPFLVVIGADDDLIAVQDSQGFAALLSQDGFNVQYELLPGVGHTVTNQGRELTIALFRKSIGK